MRKFKFIGIILALFLVAGCAHTQTQQGAYYEALGVWYDTGMQFKRYYQAADPATQAMWDADFRPLLIKAKEVLDIWYIHMDDGQPTDGDVHAWQALKNDILFYMAANIQGKL